MPSVLRSTTKNKRKRKSVQCLCGCEKVQTTHRSSKSNEVKKKHESPVNKRTFKNANKLSKSKKITNSNQPIIKQLKVILTPLNFDKIQQINTESSLTTSQENFILPKTKLRKRKTVKYRESSLESTKIQEDKKKIPVYQQQIPENNLKRQKKDQYEFDDSESEKNKKRRKLNDSSIGYEIPTKNKKLKKTSKKITKKRVPKKTIKEPITQHKSIEIKEQEPGEGSPANNFNFCEVDTPPTSPKIKILSNIQLQSRNELNISIASPACFKDGNPNANSTMIQPTKVLTPWRFNDINITRNPHFISIKDSSLPRIDQELVLNHTLVDKLNNSVRSDVENHVPKILKQSKLNDFLKCKDAGKENLENSTISLFDIDQFSPIKSRNGISNNTETVKRRILGEIHDNHQTSPARSLQEITPPKTPNLQDSINESYTDFGFGSSDISPIKSTTDKPYRLSVSIADRKYCRKPKKYFRKEESLPPSSSSEDDSDNESNEDIEGRQIKLFDDFVNTQEMIEEQEVKTAKINKLRKQRKLERKQRDVRTKEEEAEAEKWAAAFNSMCEEIEQFPLEIE